MRLADAAIWCAAIAAGLWATGRFLQGALRMLEVLAVECAALAYWQRAGYAGLVLAFQTPDHGDCYCFS